MPAEMMCFWYRTKPKYREKALISITFYYKQGKYVYILGKTQSRSIIELHFTLKIIIKKKSLRTSNNFHICWFVGKSFWLNFFLFCFSFNNFVCMSLVYLAETILRSQSHIQNVYVHINTNTHWDVPINLQKQFMFGYQKLIWKILFAKFILILVCFFLLLCFFQLWGLFDTTGCWNWFFFS